ncbi:membrane protein [Mameliella alba]|uniref:Inner membrane protein n=1 Tax=Mameliella alba TaxID=561184 RepID=A0A0B3S4M5_9RHOB|nr:MULTISPECIES: MAPEG family protein [Mameliella]MCR9275257.1 MAPEG family protein [Paracoccaceae bacterium]KHQ55217.1 Inner membrane protein [Mameliella alba]OWV49145.1 MAPEG family protein [Mameliella alba]OWV59130.1 MAPEG family protein [Mameliella alba]PTR40865.1 putative MAPEG superfamily protein [Mameliella alba]
MTPELTALTLAALLQVVQYVLMSVPANLELGMGKTMSPRDRDRLGGSLEDQLSVKTARLKRALDNHFEGLILFAIAVFVITWSDQGNGITAALSGLYLLARILYVPAYYFGWAPWRSLIWLAGFAATVLMLLLAVL